MDTKKLQDKIESIIYAMDGSCSCCGPTDNEMMLRKIMFAIIHGTEDDGVYRSTDVGNYMIPESLEETFEYLYVTGQLCNNAFR